MSTIVVTNRNDFDLNDRYDGVDYSFPKGMAVEVPMDAAHHIFGLGDEDKTPCLVRQGWLQTTRDHESAREKLNKFTFSSPERRPAMVEAPAEQGEHEIGAADVGGVVADDSLPAEFGAGEHEATQAPRKVLGRPRKSG